MDFGKIILHSYRRCPFAIRVRMTLEEKRLPYEVFEENLSSPSETLRNLHPECLVPLLIHRQTNGTEIVLYESAIITEYLEETFPNPPLLPKSPILKANFRLWTQWISGPFKTDLDLYKYDLKSLSNDESTALTARLHLHLQKIEKTLSKHEWLLDDSMFSLADIHVFPLIRQFSRVNPTFPELSKYPETISWLNRILERPSFESVMKKPTSLEKS